MKKEIWFDMDGTIADLYGVEDWLPMLIAEDATPYAIAKPLVNMNVLARRLNALQKLGYKIGIVSWLSKTSTPEYDELVTIAKTSWLKHHLGSVKFDKVDIVAYGTPKWKGRKGILFDDERKNRDEWDINLAGDAYEPHEIMDVLKALA